MISHKTILIPFNLPWDWSADYQRQTCQILAKNNRVIAYFPHKAKFFVKAITDHKKKNLTGSEKIEAFVPHYYLPLRRFPFIEKLNKKISLKILSKYIPQNTILWLFDPIFHQYPTILKNSLSLSLYDCVDYHCAFSDSEGEKNLIKKQENNLMKNVDLVFTNSQTLRDIHKKYKPKQVPQGFDAISFTQVKEMGLNLPTNKPLIGFVGGINQRLDFKLLSQLIKSNRHWNFVFVGPLQFKNQKDKKILMNKLKKIKQYPNFFLKKGVNRKLIPGLIKKFDVCMIPYDINDKANLYSYPMKLFEYFYIGKPVISTPIQELKLAKFKPFIKLKNTSQDWEKAISHFLSLEWTQEKMAQQKKLALENTWSKKIEAISNTLESYSI